MEIEDKLQALREEYKFATEDRRAQIRRTAEQIKESAHKYPPVLLSKGELRKTVEPFTQMVKDSLLNS